jgi:hypothetical protein
MVKAIVKAQLSSLAGLFVIAVPLAPLAHAQANASYTVILQEVLTTRSGVSSVVSVEVHAQRQDGATVLQLGPEGRTARHIRLPPGLLIETNDGEKRKSTFHVSSNRAIGYLRDPQQHCRRDGDAFQGEEVIGGYRAAKIVSAGGGSTRWYALDHSCAMVRSMMEHADGTKSEKYLVSLAPGAPADALFQTDGYVEGPPSALEVVTGCDSACEQRRKRRDADYYRLSPKGRH